MSTGRPSIEVEALHKSFGAVEAVKDVSFTVTPGQVFCLVGPNGAGKTTTINCIIGLEEPDAGTVRVRGRSPRRNRSRLFEEVGVQFQENSLYPRIKVDEALRHFAWLYDDPLDPNDLLKTFALQERRDTAYKSLSGGEKRKLCVALALVGDPRLVVLDEPTSGLDPHARRAFWHTLRRFQERGLTVLLTTHNLQEAEEQSDVVCLFEEGEIIAKGRPRALVEEHQLGTRVAVHTNGTLGAGAFDGVPGLTRTDATDHKLCLYGRGDHFLSAVTDVLEARGAREYAVRPAGLEDLYLMITGNPYIQANP